MRSIAWFMRRIRRLSLEQVSVAVCLLLRRWRQGLAAMLCCLLLSGHKPHGSCNPTIHLFLVCCDSSLALLTRCAGYDFEILAWDPFTHDMCMKFAGHFKSIAGIQIVYTPEERLLSLDETGERCSVMFVLGKSTAADALMAH